MKKRTVIYLLGGYYSSWRVQKEKDMETTAAAEEKNHPLPVLTENEKALIDAASNGEVAKAKLPLENGVNVNTKRKNDLTALRWAGIKGHNGIIELLKTAGAKE